jgi:hypothetical protein
VAIARPATDYARIALGPDVLVEEGYHYDASIFPSGTIATAFRRAAPPPRSSAMADR